MIKLTIVITTFLFFYSTGGFGQSEKLTVPLTNPGKTYTLDVGLMSGSIKVSSYAGKEILIEVTDVTPAEKELKTTQSGMRRISRSEGYELTANEHNNEVTVHSPANRTLVLDLKIPQNVKLKLNTINRGVIEVENVKGEVEANNINGPVYLKNISGSVVASTISGELVVNFLSVDSAASMAFSSLSRKIDITFPASMKADFKIKSDWGEIYSDFDMEIKKNESKGRQISSPGSFKISKDDWVYGKINGGGPEILMKSMHGNIYIRKAK